MNRFSRLIIVGACFFMGSLWSSSATAQPPGKLLFSRVEIVGFFEHVAIKNPNTFPVDLSDYYLTDAVFSPGNTFYYNLPDPALPIGGGAFYDFAARFPTGEVIGPGEEIFVAIRGSGPFQDAFGAPPHFELYEDGQSPDAVPDMVPARPGSIFNDPAAPPQLSNLGEVVILFYWDGQSDLIVDIDYLVWGDKDEAVDKTGVAIDGPDLDSMPSTYRADTPIILQDALIGGQNAAFLRIDETEGNQASSGGNGIDGRDETSENLSGTWTLSTERPVPVRSTTWGFIKRRFGSSIR